jgi:hypothetical protein
MENKIIEENTEIMLQNGIIRPSHRPWSSPVVLVKKKDGSYRCCIDFRELNKITHKDVYSLPRIEKALDSLGKARFFSTLDMANGYWQIPLAEEDKEKTAFMTRKGLLEFNYMPFGLCNALATFQRTMDIV